MKLFLAAALAVSAALGVLAQTGRRQRQQQPRAAAAPAGYWPLEKSAPLVERTQATRLAPDLSHLTAGERTAVAKLLEVGKIFQELYEQQRHARSLEAFRDLQRLDAQSGSTSRNGSRLFSSVVAIGPWKSR